MRNNQNLPNRRTDSNNVNGRQLPSTSPVYNSSRSRTPNRPQSRNNYKITSNQIIKDTVILITNIIIEIQVTIETISIEVEQTATTEKIIIIDITIVDQAQDT